MTPFKGLWRLRQAHFRAARHPSSELCGRGRRVCNVSTSCPSSMGLPAGHGLWSLDRRAELRGQMAESSEMTVVRSLLCPQWTSQLAGARVKVLPALLTGLQIETNVFVFPLRFQADSASTKHFPAEKSTWAFSALLSTAKAKLSQTAELYASGMFRSPVSRAFQHSMLNRLEKPTPDSYSRTPKTMSQGVARVGFSFGSSWKACLMSPFVQLKG